jgi:hypothetical protein
LEEPKNFVLYSLSLINPDDGNMNDKPVSVLSMQAQMEGKMIADISIPL